jgi:hypothetical protein
MRHEKFVEANFNGGNPPTRLNLIERTFGGGIQELKSVAI